MTAITSLLALFDPSWAERIGWALVHSVWQLAAVSMLLAIAFRLLRGASPRARYLVGCAALIAFATLPIITALLIAPRASEQAAEFQHGVALLGMATVPGGFTNSPATDQASHAHPDLAVVPSVVSPVEIETAVPSEALSRTVSASGEFTVALLADQVRPRLPWLVAAWAAGVLLLSLRLCASWSRLRKLRTGGTVAADYLSVALRDLKVRLSVTRPVTLLESALVEVPTVFGWLRPVILIPASAVTGLTASQLEAVLAHELAHIRRHDYLVNLAQSALETLLFYHPAVWWASARVRQEREHCCDDLAAAACGDVAGYAGALLRLEELRPGPRIALAATGGDLLRRVRRIAGAAERDRLPAWAAGPIALCVAIVPIAALRAASEEATPTVDAAVADIHTQEDESVRPNLTGTATSPDGQPVVGATVFIYSAGVRTGTATLCPSCYPDCVKRAVTDGAGRFTISSLDPELLFRILVAAEGHEPTFAMKVDPATGPLAVTVKPRSVNGSDPKLLIRGRVVDHEGHPVLGAVLSPKGVRRDRTTSFGATTLDPIAVTNEQGEFVVHASGPFDGATFLVEARGMANEVSKEFAAGETAALVELGPGCIVSGKLLRDEKPVPGAKVGLVQIDRNSATFLGPKEIGTDDRGVFLFDNVGPDEAYLIYSLVDGVPDGGVTQAKRIVTGSDGESLDTGVLEIVTGHTIAGRVVLADDKPMPPDVRIGLYRDGAWDSSRAVVDAEGRFALRGVPGEAVRLSLRVPGYRLSTKNKSFLPIRANLTGLVDRNRDDLLVLMEPGDPKFSWPQDQEEQSRGFERERFLQRQPLEGAPVDWERIPAPAEAELSDGINRRRFGAAVAPPASPSRPTPATSTTAAAPSAPPISEPRPIPGPTATPSSGPTVTIEGVAHGEGEAPIEGATVRVLRYHGEREGDELARLDTKADGVFRFERLPATPADEEAITYLVAVRKAGLSSAMRVVPSGRPRALDVTLLPPAVLRGRVLDERRNGVVGAVVYRHGIGGRPIPGVWTATSGEDGYYEIIDPPPWRAGGEGIEHGLGWPSGGKHSRMIFRVHVPGYARALASYGELPATVDVSLTPAAVIEGRVVDAVTGEPLANAKVYARGIDDGSRKIREGSSAVTDAKGGYKFDALDAGTINLYSRFPGRVVAPLAAFPAQAGETAQAPDLVMIEGGIVTGRVLDVDTGRPLSRTQWGTLIRVAANAADVRGGIVLDSVPVNDDGTFQLRSIGRTRVYVMLEQDAADRSIRTSASVDVKDGETVPLPSFKIRVPKPAVGAESPAGSRADDSAADKTSSVPASPTTPATNPKRSTVPKSISGRVVAGDGQPVGAARLWWVIAHGRPDVIVTGASDEEGRFSLSAPQTEPLRTSQVSDTLWVLKDGMQLATVRAGGIFTIPDQPRELLVRLEPATDTSFVIAAPGRAAVPGVLIEPWHFRTYQGYAIVPAEVRTLLGGTSDADGRVRMPGMPRNGFHTVRAISERFGTQEFRLDGERNPPAERTIQLRQVGRIEGQLVWDDSALVRGVRLGLSTEEDTSTKPSWPAEGYAEVTTDEQGRFIVPAIAEGRLRIDVVTDAAAPAIPRLPDSPTVRADETATLEIPLEPSVLVRGTIRTDDVDKPIPGAEISVRYGVGRQGVMVSSDGEGRFEARVLPGRVYTQVIVRPEEFETYEQIGAPWDEKVEVPAGDMPFDLPPIRLAHTSTLKGKLIDQEGRPVANVQLNGLKGNRRYAFARTDDKGEFSTRVPASLELEGYQVWFNDDSPSATPEVVNLNPLTLRVIQTSN